MALQSEYLNNIVMQVTQGSAVPCSTHGSPLLHRGDALLLLNPLLDALDAVCGLNVYLNLLACWVGTSGEDSRTCASLLLQGPGKT
jgi:hypothetical protein